MSNKYECPSCKKTFNETEVNMLNYCSKCARKKSTKNYKKSSIVILLLGFILGLIAGTSNDGTYNYDIMLYVWLGSCATSFFMLIIHSICYSLDLIIDKDTNK